MMRPIEFNELNQWVNNQIIGFHQSRINALEGITLNGLLKKNPYLLKAKNVTTANEVVTGALEALLSSSEEELFGMFLEKLAIHIAETTCGAHESTAEGMDMEFINNNIHFIVSIKSGTNWGNNSQQTQLQRNFEVAVRRVQQHEPSRRIQAVLGICYGKTRTSIARGAMKIVGQNFWYFISGDTELYKRIIEPIGYRAREHNEGYLQSKGTKINQLTESFLREYTIDGVIDWNRLVEYNAGNLDLDEHLPM